MEPFRKWEEESHSLTIDMEQIICEAHEKAVEDFAKSLARFGIAISTQSSESMTCRDRTGVYQRAFEQGIRKLEELESSTSGPDRKDIVKELKKAKKTQKGLAKLPARAESLLLFREKMKQKHGLP